MWALYLQDFCVLFKYRPGIVADGFLKQAWSSEEEVPQLLSRLGESTFPGTQEDPQKTPRRGDGTSPGAEEDLREENPDVVLALFLVVEEQTHEPPLKRGRDLLKEVEMWGYAPPETWHTLHEHSHPIDSHDIIINLIHFTLEPCASQSQ